MPKYSLTITTGNEKDAGTDAIVRVKLVKELEGKSAGGRFVEESDWFSLTDGKFRSGLVENFVLESSIVNPTHMQISVAGKRRVGYSWQLSKAQLATIIDDTQPDNKASTWNLNVNDEWFERSSKEVAATDTVLSASFNLEGV